MKNLASLPIGVLLVTGGMATPQKLFSQKINIALTEFQSWQLRHGKLTKTYQFKDFVHAYGFMTKVAPVAENLQPCPDWSNVCSRVTIELVTHDVGGIRCRISS